ncbi:phage head-tail connector protein [Globicatella sanguinis]
MDSTKLLAEVKLFKGINDNEQDALLKLIITDSIERILSYVNRNRNDADVLSVLPDSVNYIVRDVAIKRFNKINSEGTVADSEEGRSYTWETSYLSEYKDILDSLTNKEYGGQGIARFIS